MENQQSVLDTIQIRYDSFFEQEKKIAGFILQNYKDVINMTIGDLADASGTSVATVSRFCRKCEVDGFHHLKIGLAKELVLGESEVRVSNDISRKDIGQSLQNILANKIEEMKQTAAQMLECNVDDTRFEGDHVSCISTGKTVTTAEIGVHSMCANNHALQVTESHYSPVSPPPFMVGMAEVEIDKETGELELIDYVAVVDCGTPLNPNLARVQVEGGLGQGIGMALYENVQYTDYGRMMNNSLMQYKIPARVDVCRLRVEFESSYEQSGPFGAKSIGEIVINTPSPALAHAVANATGIWVRELPITPEKIAMGTPEE